MVLSCVSRSSLLITVWDVDRFDKFAKAYFNGDEQDEGDKIFKNSFLGKPVWGITMLHEELTEKIIAACFDVSNELGAGFLESVYEKALLIALADRGLDAKSQVPLQVRFKDQVVGDFYADIVVENRILVELKAVKNLAPEHQAQTINYLKATGIEIGLLVNFGNPKLEYRRFQRQKMNADVEQIQQQVF